MRKLVNSIERLHLNMVDKNVNNNYSKSWVKGKRIFTSVTRSHHHFLLTDIVNINVFADDCPIKSKK